MIFCYHFKVQIVTNLFLFLSQVWAYCFIKKNFVSINRYVPDDKGDRYRQSCLSLMLQILSCCIQKKIFLFEIFGYQASVFQWFPLSILIMLFGCETKWTLIFHQYIIFIMRSISIISSSLWDTAYVNWSL